MSEAGAGLAVVSGARLTDRIGIGVLTRLIDRDLVDDVLAGTGRVEQRSRLLPARVVVYYVLALCLFFGDAYEEVMRLLVAGLLFTGAWQKDWQVPTTGAIAQARQRLGAAPLQLLFERVAVPCAQRGTPGAWLGSRKLMAMDGFVLDIPDTKENDTAFGRSGGEKNPAPFPQVRVVGLGECGTHAIVAARLAAWRVSERALAGDLSGELGPGMLVIADRGFYSYRLWQAAAASGADLLWRLQSGPNLPVVRAFPDGSYESFLLDPKVRGRRATQRHRGSKNIEEPTGIPVRVIEYEVTNREGKGEIFCLITTIMDPQDATAAELAAAYQDRWEFEIGHLWYRSSCAVFSWLRSFVVAGFRVGRCPAGAGVEARGACPALVVCGDDPVLGSGGVAGGDPAAVDPVVDGGGGHAQLGGQAGD